VQELEVKLDGDITLQNGLQFVEAGVLGPTGLLLDVPRPTGRRVLAVCIHGLCRPLLLLYRYRLGGSLHEVRDSRQELWLLVLEQVESDLVRKEDAVRVLGEQVPEDLRHRRWLVQKHQTLADHHPVRLRKLLVQVDHQPQGLLPELSAHDEVLADVQRVGQEVLVKLTVLRDSPQQVELARVQRDADGLLELPVLEAPGEHPLHDGLEPRVDLNFLPRNLGLLPALHVLVNALAHDRLHVVAPLGDVEELARAQSVRKGLLELPEVVEHL